MTEVQAPRAGSDWSLLAILLPLFYILSMGPIAALEQAAEKHNPKLVQQCDPFFRAFYSPIFWLCDRIQGCGKMVELYFRLWGIK